jgi:hypothetical protein
MLPVCGAFQVGEQKKEVSNRRNLAQVFAFGWSLPRLEGEISNAECTEIGGGVHHGFWKKRA